MYFDILLSKITFWDFNSSGLSFLTFSKDFSTSSGIWSMPTALPFSPNIIAIQAVKYPDPEPISKARSPSNNWSFKSSKAYAC